MRKETDMFVWKKIIVSLLILSFGIIAVSAKCGTEVKPKNEYIKTLAIAFLKQEECILQLHCQDTANGDIKQDTVLLFSNDAGVKWIKIPIQCKSNPLSVLFDKEGILSLWFHDGTLWKSKPPFDSWLKENDRYVPSSILSYFGILESGKMICCAMSMSGLYEWYISDDDGRLWQNLFKDKSCEYIFQKGNQQSSFLKLCHNKDQVDIEISYDEGQTWKPKGQYTYDSILIPNGGFEKRILKMFNNSLLLSGSNNDALPVANMSIDLGKTWDSTAIQEALGLQITDEVIFGQENAIIVISDRIMATMDAGKTWKCVWGPKRSCWLEKCYLSPKGEVWVIGNKVLKSSDGIKFKEVKVE
jgi:photosystem II stability/assembly factor-like uncharacterized protein